MYVRRSILSSVTAVAVILCWPCVWVTSQPSPVTDRPSYLSQAPKPNIENATYSCALIRKVFVDEGIVRDIAELPKTSVSGTSLSLCESRQSCCTPVMERQLLAQSGRDFHAILKRATAPVRSVLTDGTAMLTEEISTLIRQASNNTLVLFQKVYQKMATLARDPIHKLFADLESLALTNIAADIGGQAVVLESSVKIFFDQLFPLVYIHSINPLMKDFNEDYRQCMMKAQAEIAPFGDVPRKMQISLGRSIDAARALLHALSVGVEAVDNVANAELTSECQTALIRTTWCQRCQATLLPPCHNFCLNIARGCLTGITVDMEQPWHDYVAAVEKVAGVIAGMSGMSTTTTTSALTDLFYSTDAQISDAVMFAMESGPTLEKKVKSICGHLQRAGSRDFTSDAYTPSSNYVTSSTPAHPIRTEDTGKNEQKVHRFTERVQRFLHNFEPSRSLFVGLVDVVCDDPRLATSNATNCWTGTEIGEYKQLVAAAGLDAQKYNPEMRVQRNQDVNVAHLSDKLRHVKQLLQTHVTSLPASDSLVVDNGGSGSGYYAGRGAPDEERSYWTGEDGSGSGAGADDTEPTDRRKPNRPTSTDIEFSEDVTPDVTVQHKADGASSLRSHGALFAFIVLLMTLRFFD